jgi:hypothetical protein
MNIQTTVTTRVTGFSLTYSGGGDINLIEVGRDVQRNLGVRSHHDVRRGSLDR